MVDKVAPKQTGYTLIPSCVNLKKYADENKLGAVDLKAAETCANDVVSIYGDPDVPEPDRKRIVEHGIDALQRTDAKLGDNKNLKNAVKPIVNEAYGYDIPIFTRSKITESGDVNTLTGTLFPPKVFEINNGRITK